VSSHTFTGPHTYSILFSSAAHEHDRSQTTFPSLTVASQRTPYLVMLAQPSWSYITEISEQHNESLSTAMQDLNINEGSLLAQAGKPPCSFKRLYFHLLLLFHAASSDTGPQSNTTTSSPITAPFQDTIESLRNELLGKINSQANDIAELKTSNAELKTSNAELKTSNAELKSSNTKFQSLIAGLQSSHIKLQSSHNKLQSSHTKLQSSHAELHSLHAELQSSHAELQSLHAELQSLHAELQSSNGELQSSNTKLQASNSELKSSNAMLSADLQRVSF
jgi:DNA repair exonuclease SbcCD ATPase subunit